MVDLVEYVDEAGRSPLGRWLQTLDGTTHGRVLDTTLRLAQGNFSNVKGVGNGIYELRMDFGPGYRVYFAKIGNAIVLLLGGGTKKRQQTDIEAAKAAWQAYRQREKA